MNLSDLSRLLAPIRRKLYLMIGRALLVAVNHSGESGFFPGSTNPQKIQVSGVEGETLTDIEHWQPYGFSSYPIAGVAEVMMLCLDGIRDNAHSICIRDNEYRPTDLDEGDACVYGKKDKDNQQHRIRLKANGDVEILVEPGNKISIGSGDVDILLDSGKKVSVGNGTDELLDILDQLLTLLQGSVDTPGTGSTGTLSLVLADLATLQTSLGNIKV